MPIRLNPAIAATIAASMTLGACANSPTASTTSGSEDDATPTVAATALQEPGASFVGGAEGSPNRSRVHSVVPPSPDATPLVMLPGLGLDATIYLGTPDGRDGWADLAAEDGYLALAVDGPSLVASGSEQALAAASAGSLNQWSADQIWPRWGFGEQVGEPYADTRFPVQAIDQFIADLPEYAGGGAGGPAGSGRRSGGNAEANGRGGGAQASADDVAALIQVLEASGPAVLMAHSASGTTAFEVARTRPELVEAIVAIEPVGCPTDPANTPPVPLLAVYGDRITERRQGDRMSACADAVQAATSTGQSAKLLSLPEQGISGNTHLLMQDDNSEEVWRRIAQFLDDALAD